MSDVAIPFEWVASMRGKATELLVFVLIFYFVVGTWLSFRATAHLKDRSKIHIFTVMHDAELFTEEGNHLRVVANRFWLIGGLVAAVALFLL